MRMNGQKERKTSLVSIFYSNFAQMKINDHYTA